MYQMYERQERVTGKMVRRREEERKGEGAKAREQAS
jgi:hypothetical protein